ncbi:hypothetical protein LTR78_006827 [Recurvomyces mirabilis]|uniref:Sfi1 spindle body domain-containing protein n=1 Tax=Recurvomyces mirabilis TaxID=574656 RepID=A0AAE1BZE7_9PEZI|nr:hypothetical protein LTR78_006827 [Recurvomyces mirabilis]KAK5153183.1 hypothetical protein LTS14_007828 [Recurvomyces mirabilis]
MSDNAPIPDELPELSDEDINLLHQICTLANDNNAPPFRALFSAYDRIFQEQAIEAEHDGVVFRYLLRVGEAAREGGSRAGDGRLDLVGCLKSILQSQGITVLEESDGGDGVSEVTREQEGREGHAGDAVNSGERRKQAGKRRVSFNDARLDETWLSEHSRSVAISPSKQRRVRLLAQPARRARLPDGTERRARSISSHREPRNFSSRPAPNQRPVSPSTNYTSEYDDHVNPTLLFQPSQTQLEQNAEAFADTSAIRIARRVLHIWHDRTLALYQSQQQANAIATAHDRHVLAKQALDQWRAHFTVRQDAKTEDELRKHQDAVASERYIRDLMRRSISHWDASIKYQREQVAEGLRHMLQYRYFHRWKLIAQENIVKARSILRKKYLPVWREKLARRQLKEEQAVAFCEEQQVQRCWKSWFWHFCSRRVEGWRDDNTKRRSLTAWEGRLAVRKDQEDLARQHDRRLALARAMSAVRNRAAHHQQASHQAQAYYVRTFTCRIFKTITIQARLEPFGRALTLKVRLDLQRKAFRIWHLHLLLTQQAGEVERKRVLQSAWTQWNDALRCRALGQRIDDRILIESLYKWVLAERMRLFRRTLEAKLLRRVMCVWTERLLTLQTQTQDMEVAFREAQERRLLSIGLVRLNLALRKREDAERAAVEFASARALPNAMFALTTKFRKVQQLNKWAQDARFYTLCTRTLAVWHEQTTEEQHARRRNAYAAVRARIKIRVVSSALDQWQNRTQIRVSMNTEAEQFSQRRAMTTGTRNFQRWRSKAAQVQQMREHATELDEQRLLSSAFSALANRHVLLLSVKEQAIVFKQDVDLALLASAFKRIQWAHFTATQRAQSAEALWFRNRDAHVRNMLRTWAVQTAERRAMRLGEQEGQGGRDEEPESPSLRPASRAAERSSALPYRDSHLTSSPPQVTPAYMRTPSRSRRAGRFRPLPTPAVVTPFAFERSYLATTPAPLGTRQASLAIDHTTTVDHSVGGLDALAPQVTPFARKLRAGGFRAGLGGGGESTTPLPPLRTSIFGRSIGQAGAGGTAKSVRFAGSSRFGGEGHLKSS